MTSVLRSTGEKPKRCLPLGESGSARQPASPPPPLLAAMLESHRAAAKLHSARPRHHFFLQASLVEPLFFFAMNQCSTSDRSTKVSIGC